MRRITIWLFSTVAALVLLFSYRTSTGTPPAATARATEPATPPAVPGKPPVATAPGRGASGGTRSGSAVTRTYTGATAATRWGDVQVVIAVTGRKITDVRIPVYPTGNHRDQEINAYALPVLRQETLDAQSPNIDTVSGATVTSDGYLRSLQSALDAAHLR